MDTISLYKNRIDGLMNILFGAGVSNPQTIIEQLNYLLFLRALSIKDDEAELLGITDESEKIFSGDLKKYKWQNLLALNAEDLFKTLEESFDVLQKKSKNPTVKLLFRNAHVKIFDKPTLRRILHEIEVFAKELDAITNEGNKDVFGDMYEYLLSKLSSAGTNGQFRTPRHIIDFMVRVVDPKKNETILDPACGTAGFLVAAYRYLATEYTSERMKKAGSSRAMDKLSAEDKNFLFKHMFTGFDSDEDMIKFGMMNLHLHGLAKSRLIRQNSLTDTSGMEDKFDVILANPPFSGKIDEGSISEDIRMGTKATELLFLRFMMDHLSPKGKMAVVVPEGVVSNTSIANKKIRQMLIEKGLWVIVSLPSGVFNPYSGVKTNLIFIDKEIAKKKEELIFIKIENDGFDLGAQRRPIKQNDLPIVLEVLNGWKSGKKIQNELVSYIKKSKITKDSDYSFNIDHFKKTTDFSNVKWPVVSIEDVVTTVTPPVKIKKIHFKETGSYPIIDQSQDEISGWTDDLQSLIKVEKPVVIFGDHTCSVKYMEKPFAQGADGIKILLTNNKLIPKFLFFILKFNPIKIDGYKRHFSKLKKYKIVLPSVEVQKQIINELENYQNIIDGAQKVINNYNPVFEIENDWKKYKIGDLITLEYGKPLPKGKRSNGVHAVLGSNGVTGYHDNFLATGPGIVVGRKGSAGEVVWVEENFWPIDTTFYVKQKDDTVNPRFLYYILKHANLSKVKGGAGVPGVNRNDIYNIEVSIPDIITQAQVVSELDGVASTINDLKKLVQSNKNLIANRLSKLWSK